MPSWPWPKRRRSGRREPGACAPSWKTSCWTSCTSCPRSRGSASASSIAKSWPSASSPSSCTRRRPSRPDPSCSPPVPPPVASIRTRRRRLPGRRRLRRGMHASTLTRRPILLALTLTLLLGLLPGCAVYDYFYGGKSASRRETVRSDQDLLRSAETQIQRRNYEDARKELQQLINQYPESELLAAARLTSAKALFLAKRYDEARTEYQRFLELHPQHEQADEAHYFLGMTYFKQSDTPDRDQTYTKKALEEFDLLLKQMPDSQYAEDAKAKTAVARWKLAEKEV